MASQAEYQEMLYAYIEHDIKLENNVFHGLTDVPRAVEMLKKGEYRGKACIVIDEDAPGVLPDSSRM
jgi:propanol-preferring alcohol dehydrogenase